MRAVLPLRGRFIFAHSHVGDSGAYVLSAAGKERLLGSLLVRCGDCDEFWMVLYAAL